MSRSLVKQDINFMEHPLWFQNGKNLPENEHFRWEDNKGFIYKAGRRPPSRTDMLFLLALLRKSQQDDWNEAVETTRYEVITDCGINPDTGTYWFRRFSDSLDCWQEVNVEFNGTFYDGKNYKTIKFGIIDAWKIEAETNRLTIYFSPFWLAHIQHSNFFKMIDFEEFKSLRASLAARLYELLVKNFHRRDSWRIDGLKLAEKIPMTERYVARIIPKINKAVETINEQTDLQVTVSVRRPKRGKATFTFRKKSPQIETTEEPTNLELFESTDESNLLLLVPVIHRSKKTIIRAVEKAFRRHGAEYVRRNILYANENARKNYRVYVIDALKKDWAVDWWKERLERNQAVAEASAEQESFFVEQMESVDQDLAAISAEFVSLTSPTHLEQIEQQVRENVSTEPEDQQEMLFKWQLRNLLEKGVQAYKN